VKKNAKGLKYGVRNIFMCALTLTVTGLLPICRRL